MRPQQGLRLLLQALETGVLGKGMGHAGLLSRECPVSADGRAERRLAAVLSIAQVGVVPLPRTGGALTRTAEILTALASEAQTPSEQGLL